MKYDKSTFTYGFEMEIGDVLRTTKIPAHLGEWEHGERDIVNTIGPWRGVCADPLGDSPPVGGEINTVPTRGWRPQVDKILEIVEFFKAQGQTPTSPFTTHNHTHIHVPGLMEDIDGLKRLMAYIRDNQQVFVNAVYTYYETPEMRSVPEAKNYLKLDGGRLIPSWRCDSIIKNATDFNSFILHHYTGKDGVSTGRPIRTAINTYCMKHTKTIEFRCFRGSFERVHLEAGFEIVEAFMDAALNDGPPIHEILRSKKWEFPPMKFEMDLAKGWIGTKWPETRNGGKNRKFIEVA